MNENKIIRRAMIMEILPRQFDGPYVTPYIYKSENTALASLKRNFDISASEMTDILSGKTNNDDYRYLFSEFFNKYDKLLDVYVRYYQSKYGELKEVYYIYEEGAGYHGE